MNKPIWWDRYFSSWSKEHDEYYEKYKSDIQNMDKTMNWTDEYDASIKMEANTRSVKYSGRNIPTQIFIEKF